MKDYRELSEILQNPFMAMWFQLKEYLNTKTSHGKNELLDKMREMETDLLIKIYGNNIAEIIKKQAE